MFDNYVVHLMSDREAIQLSLWDTAGQEDFDRIRVEHRLSLVSLSLSRYLETNR